MKNCPTLIANLTLSGEEIQVGTYTSEEGESVWLRTNDNAEAIYISVSEATLLIAALKTARHRAKVQEA